MVWNINTIVPIVAFFFFCTLYLIVALSKPQTQHKRAFRLYLLAKVLWSLSAFLVLINIPWTTFWFRLMSASALAAFITIFYFVQVFLDKRRKWSKYVIIYGVIASIISVFTDWVILSATASRGVVESYEFAPLIGVLVGPGYLLGLYVLYELIRGYRETTDLIGKNRLRYLLVGIGIMMAATLVNFTPLGRYPIDIAANGLTAILIAYAILRYHLFDIRVVIRQGLLYSIPTAVIGTAYFLIITFSLQLFDIYSGIELYLLSLLVAVIAALAAEPLRVKAQNLIDKRFFREKYNSRRMLQNLSSRVASILDLEKITNIILEEVTSTLHVSRAAFFLKNDANGRFNLTTQVGLDQTDNISFRKQHPVVLWLSSHDFPLSRHELEVHPQFKSMWGIEREELKAIDTELLIPIKVQSELVGIFSLGKKRSEQAYDEDDKLTLITLANQTAVAIENARLYTAEQNRRMELDTLYSIARQLVATDNLDAVLGSIASHAVESIHVTYARVLTRNEQGDYLCRAVYPAHKLTQELGLGRTEPIVAEQYYNWILQREKAVVIYRDDPDLQVEEIEAIFFNKARTLCLSPLIGVDEYIGLLVLGEVRRTDREPFSPAKMRLVNVISDHATSAIQRAILHEQLEENFLQTVVSLANAMDARDKYTSDHSQRMADLSTALGFEMGLSESQIEAVHWAALLHDIGKIGVPDEILKKPGPLTKKEWETMKKHPVIGSKIVAPIKMLAPVAPIIRAHHERFDGTGYPNGLSGEDIPLESRIMAVVDAYIAIRDKRIYSEAHSHEEAIAEIRRNSGTQFDPEVVDHFCRMF